MNIFERAGNSATRDTLSQGIEPTDTNKAAQL